VRNSEWINVDVRFHPRGEKKIQVLAKELWGQPLIHLACGDSATSDGPMLKLAQHGFLRNKQTGLFEPIGRE
jgi:phosphoserine phosphatase